MSSEAEYKKAIERLNKHRDALNARAEFTRSLPKFDDRGVIVGVKEDKNNDRSK